MRISRSLIHCEMHMNFKAQAIKMKESLFEHGGYFGQKLGVRPSNFHPINFKLDRSIQNPIQSIFWKYRAGKQRLRKRNFGDRKTAIQASSRSLGENLQIRKKWKKSFCAHMNKASLTNLLSNYKISLQN